MNTINIVVFKPFTVSGYLADIFIYHVKGLLGLGVQGDVQLIRVPDDGTAIDSPIALIDGYEFKLQTIDDVELALEYLVRTWILRNTGGGREVEGATSEELAVLV